MHRPPEEQADSTTSPQKAVPEALVRKVREVTGLVRLEGLIFWSQHQLLRSLDDPFAKKILEVIDSMDPMTRTWEKILKKLDEYGA